MEQLQKELLQAQASRDELMKWKLLLVSAIGSAALGFSQSTVLQHAPLALCLLPFACCYVDLLCRNLSVRTLLLSRFFAAEQVTHPNEVSMRFESFYSLFHKRRPNSLEGLALRWSTLVLSIAITPVGAMAYAGATLSVDVLFKWPTYLLLASSLMGLVVSIQTQRTYMDQKRAIEGALDEWTKHHEVGLSDDG